MKRIVVVGSIALDSVSTPEGKSQDALGGSAVYFSLAARHFTPISLVGVVGQDFPAAHEKMLADRDIDLSGLEKKAGGKTFRWVGKFGKDFDQAQTLDTQLNVLEGFDPKLGEQHKDAPILFLGNIDPELQFEVLSQMKAPQIVAADTMNFWINSKRPQIKELLARVHVLFINEEEAQELSGEPSNVRAARKLAEWGPQVVVLKKGEHGALLFTQGEVYPFPSFPVDTVKDPTGAGDSFAGAFMGALAADPDLRDVQKLKRALVYGASMASFNVSDFSTGVLEGLSRDALDERVRQYVKLLSVELEGVPA